MRKTILAACIIGAMPEAWAQYAYNGSTGYINTHSAHMSPDGTMVVGVSHASPYSLLYVSMQALPWLEVTGRYSQTQGVPGLPDAPEYGSYKDKSFAAKVQLWPEGAAGLSALPAFAVGAEDAFLGTKVFESYYAVASQKVGLWGGELDWSLGYGKKRLQGGFAGLRYSHPGLPGWAWVSDYDSINFSQDVGAAYIGLDQRKPGQFNHAIEYSPAPGWAIQAGRRDGQWGINLSMTVPFGQRSLTPKTREPAPYVSFAPRPSDAQWTDQPTERNTVVARMYEAGYREVGVSYADRTLSASFVSNRYIDSSRAVGRAARILLAHAPEGTQRLLLTQKVNGMPTLRYEFEDLKKLQAFFDGALPLTALEPSVRLALAGQDRTTDTLPAPDLAQALAQVGDSGNDGLQTSVALDKRLSGEQLVSGHNWSLGPRIELYFNDPSGALKGSLGLEASGQLKLTPSTHLDAAAGARLAENITDVQQPSNSVLPHVRSDIAEYFRGSRFKLDKLVLNHYWQPSRQWYARLSAGAYETMYAGAGGQIMFVPERAGWSVDATADYLAQRDFSSPFKLQDYRVFTGLVSAHVELPYQMTITARAGRFLAKDTGTRLEFKRELPSGVQFGLWYSVTNGRDITSPGSPDQPYRDKGIFMSIPLDVVSDSHSRRVVTASLSPWTRDVGQMVRSPGDLRQLLERGTLRALQSPAPLSNLGGVDAEDGR
jgi:hypothetical protein